MSITLPTAECDIYPQNRDFAFQEIRRALGKHEAYHGASFSLCQGDSLKLLPLIPDHSVDLVLVDPPYHSTKKSNIYGDSDFAADEEFVAWISELGREWKRVLKANGSLYLFCSPDMAPLLYVALRENYNLLSMITWTKPNEPGYDGWRQKMNKTSLRRWYPHTERIIFATPAVEGNLKRSPFGHFLKDCRKKCGLTANKLTELAEAYGKVNNGGAVSNWETGRNIPSRLQYKKICDGLIATGRITRMPAYEDVIRAFIVDPSEPWIDVWDFMNVRQYRGKHPAEKPQDLLQHIVKTSSYPGDVVLDCFAGSGSAVAAAASLGRQGIGIEIEDKWVDYSAGFVKKHLDREVALLKNREADDPSSSTEAMPLFA